MTGSGGLSRFIKTYTSHQVVLRTVVSRLILDLNGYRPSFKSILTVRKNIHVVLNTYVYI